MTSLLRDWFDYLVEIQEQITSYYDEAGLQHSINEIEDAIEMADEDDNETDPENESSAAMNDYMISKMMQAFAEHEIARFGRIDDRSKLIRAAEQLLQQKQVEQRTEAWYLEARDLLTASEIGQILKPGRTRGQLVLTKASGATRSGGNSSSAVPSELMSAFDWGVRFEPVVKMIYQSMHPGTIIHDVGRLYHPTLAKCAASPDGIVLGASEKAGRLIEIKCPVTREIRSNDHSGIPADYYAQMQQQLEVTGLEECDYMEVKFRSKYSKEITLLSEGSALFYGVIWRVEWEENDRTFTDYIYGPVGDMSSKCPTLRPGQNIIEVIPWEAIKINLITVRRDRTWWAMAEQKIAEFWADVEKARRGEFVLPAATRQTKSTTATAAKDECLFVL